MTELAKKVIRAFLKALEKEDLISAREYLKLRNFLRGI